MLLWVIRICIAKLLRMPPHKPAVPLALPIAQALQASPGLSRLALRLRESNGRFETIRPVLSGNLLAQVQPGPLDEQGWSLLASSAAVAAKLRHVLPRCEEALRDAGWPTLTIRIRVSRF
jgi:hypothetical protein